MSKNSDKIFEKNEATPEATLKILWRADWISFKNTISLAAKPTALASQERQRLVAYLTCPDFLARQGGWLRNDRLRSDQLQKYHLSCGETNRPGEPGA